MNFASGFCNRKLVYFKDNRTPKRSNSVPTTVQEMEVRPSKSRSYDVIKIDLKMMLSI